MARAKGHTVTLFNATKKVGGCKACDTCWSKGQACSFTDGFTDLEPLLEKADTVVFATPMYWFGFSAQIKAAIDRIYAYISPQTLRPPKISENALVSFAGATDQHGAAGLVSQFETLNDAIEVRSSRVTYLRGSIG